MFQISVQERKYIYNFQPNRRNAEKKTKKIFTGWRAKVNGGYDHQLFNKEKLDKLDFKEKNGMTIWLCWRKKKMMAF